MKGFLARVLYDILFFLFALFYLPSFFLKGKHGAHFFERFGKVPGPARERLKGQPVIWVHAVSVGEVAQGLRFIEALRLKKPGLGFVLTTTTAAGRQVAEVQAPSDVTVLYFPVDFGFSVRAFIGSVKPAMVVILETEIWPNLIRELSARRIPVFILNARISDGAISKYRKVRFFLKPLLNQISRIGAQDERMKSRFAELGALEGKLRVTGNMKFDYRPSAAPSAAKGEIERIKRPGSFLCVAGSTHEGEEEIFFKLYPRLKAQCPQFELVIAPRHLQRLPAIEKKAARAAVSVRRISNLSATNETPVIYLLDRMGVLAQWYEQADLVFVGGSLVKGVGGHNPVEPAYFEKAVIFGPFMDNFREIACQFKEASAAVEAAGPAALQECIFSLIHDSDRRASLGRAARALVGRHRGAVENNVEMVLEG